MRISDWSSDVCSSDLAAARSKILSGECEVALVVGADTTPKGFLKPQPGDRPDDPDWVRFRIGITNPTYFALYARRRIEMYGDTLADFAAVKVKNAAHGFSNRNARYRKKFTAEDIAASANDRKRVGEGKSGSDRVK